MKTISLELSKRLNEKGLLDNIDTEYCYVSIDDSGYEDKPQLTNSIPPDFHEWADSVKTLTLEEAIEKMIEYLLDNDLICQLKQ